MPPLPGLVAPGGVAGRPPFAALVAVPEPGRGELVPEPVRAPAPGAGTAMQRAQPSTSWGLASLTSPTVASMKPQRPRALLAFPSGEAEPTLLTVLPPAPW